MLASCTPALFIACRMWSSFGGWSKFTRIFVPPVKPTPFGIPCQNSMLSTPPTEKISENPRKYHFLPNQSIFALRKNSTLQSLSSKLVTRRIDHLRPYLRPKGSEVEESASPALLAVQT